MDQQYTPTKLFDPQTFHNHGDNPALRNLMKIAMQNHREGKTPDLRTYVYDKGRRFLLARNIEDVLQRDFKAITFPRAFAMFTLTSMGFYNVLSWTMRLMPVGRFGIRRIQQTSFFHNFGYTGVAASSAMLFAAAYVEWKTFKFTLHKFYRHVLLGDRNWLLEYDKEPAYGEYYFNDSYLSCDQNFPVNARGMIAFFKSNPTDQERKKEKRTQDLFIALDQAVGKQQELQAELRAKGLVPKPELPPLSDKMPQDFKERLIAAYEKKLKQYEQKMQQYQQNQK